MRLYFAALLACSLTVPALGAFTIDVDASPCFVGAGATGTVLPYIVTVKNHGSSVTGAAVVESGLGNSTRRYVYPLDLPAGTLKRFTIFPRIDVNGNESTLRFVGGIRARDVSLTTGLRYGEERLVCLISDRIGAISIVKSAIVRGTRVPGGPVPSGPHRPGYRAPASPATPFADCYVKPEDAPDRAVGYQSISSLIVADGAERMNVAQWSAIRRWVLGGGSLIVLGGPAAAYVNSPDAQALMPIRDPRGVTTQRIALAADSVSYLPPGPYAITVGVPVPGARVEAASQDGPLMVSRPYGSGMVLFVAFSPIESPLKGSQDSAGVWRSILATASIPERGTTLWSTDVNDLAAGGSASVPQTASVNPFRIQLPPVEVVTGILLLYFVLVVPVTYWVLKRKQRLEWAWVTSPILSVGFAFAFYLFTASLYHAGLSRRTTGTLVAAAGTTDAEFIGATEIFFPRGGSYDVTVPNAESLEANPTAGMYYSSTPNTRQDVETVDNGSVSAPNYGVNNLSFRRIYHCQPQALGGTIEAHLRIQAGRLSGTITNGTKFALHNASFHIPQLGLHAGLGSLAPGRTAQVSGVVSSGRIHPLPGGPPLVNGRSPMPKPYLSAFASADQLGIPLGRYVGAADSVLVNVSVPVIGGAT